jgi:hypothetical protein
MQKVEEIKGELAKQIAMMEKVKKEAGEEWLAFEDAVLTLLRTHKFLIDRLDAVGAFKGAEPK